jgi:hypothetical protein
VLRFLDGAAIDVRAQCSLGRYGQVSEGVERAFLIRPVDDVPLLKERSERAATWRTLITEEFLDTMAQKPIAVATRILTKESPAELEKLAMDAVRRYAHGVGSRAVQVPLLHAFTAVESLLLANESESIVHRLGVRVAFVNGRNARDRRQLIDNLKAGYGIRSRFIHHGRLPDDVAQVNRTLFACWRTVFLILLSSDKYATKADMLRAIDDRSLE